jgi:hypothetical protein
MSYSRNANRDSLEDLVQALRRIDDAWANYCTAGCNGDHDEYCVEAPDDLEKTLAAVRSSIGEAIIITTSALGTELVPVKKDKQ